MKRYPNLSNKEENLLIHAKTVSSIIDSISFIALFSLAVLNILKDSTSIVYDFTRFYTSHPKLLGYSIIFGIFVKLVTILVKAYFNAKASSVALSKTDVSVKFENIK